jgi:hypothetical protein
MAVLVPTLPLWIASLWLSERPPLPAQLERPGAFPSAAPPAPESPLPARAPVERDLRLGAFRARLEPAPSAEARGEWNDEVQPALFRVSVERAPRS